MLRTFALTCLLLIVLPSGADARTQGPPRTQPIDMVVIHSTGGPTCNDLNQPIWVRGGRFVQDLHAINAHPILGVHWMIARDGSIGAGVPESQVANHVVGYNPRSIGIELVNDGDGLEPFAPAQIDALVGLLQKIVQRYPGVTRSGVVRHSDLDLRMLPCAPQQRRKVDPGSAYPHQQVLDAVFAPQGQP
jgi:hypothetical protein